MSEGRCDCWGRLLRGIAKATPLILLTLGLFAAGIEVYLKIDQGKMVVWDKYATSDFARHSRFPSVIYFKSPVIVAGQRVRGNLTLNYEYPVGYGRVPTLHVLTFDQFSTWAVDAQLPSNPVFFSEAKRSPNSSNTSFREDFDFEATVSGIHYLVTSPDPMDARLELFIRKEVPSTLRDEWDNFRPYLGLFMVFLGIPGTVLAIVESSRRDTHKK